MNPQSHRPTTNQPHAHILLIVIAILIAGCDKPDTGDRLATTPPPVSKILGAEFIGRWEGSSGSMIHISPRANNLVFQGNPIGFDVPHIGDTPAFYTGQALEVTIGSTRVLAIYDKTSDSILFAGNYYKNNRAATAQIIWYYAFQEVVSELILGGEQDSKALVSAATNRTQLQETEATALNKELATHLSEAKEKIVQERIAQLAPPR